MFENTRRAGCVCERVACWCHPYVIQVIKVSGCHKNQGKKVQLIYIQAGQE